MTAHVRSEDQKPNAWIVNPKDRGRKSVKSDNKVYLKDGQNFEIEIHNPLKEPVLAEIKVNGKSVSATGLVLRPAERFYLDCFIDDNKKFIFKTYLVENTDESKESISGNGLIEVFFYKEETLKLNNWRQKFNPVIERHYYPVHYPWYQPPYWYYNNITIGYPGTTTNVYTSSSQNLNVSYSNGSNLLVNSNSNGGIGGAFTQTSSGNALFSNCKTQNVPNLETGRIEKGISSSQKFEEVNMEFEKYHISSIIYQLFPESQKPVETKDIKKFCQECGYKLKGNENFCPDCGEKLK